MAAGGKKGEEVGKNGFFYGPKRPRVQRPEPRAPICNFFLYIFLTFLPCLRVQKLMDGRTLDFTKIFPRILFTDIKA